MFQQRAHVHYLDGTTETVTLTQWAIGQFDMWAMKRGWSPSRADRALIQERPILFLRFAAWATLFRDAPTKTGFDEWDRTVVEVETEDADASGPTHGPTAIPDEE